MVFKKQGAEAIVVETQFQGKSISKKRIQKSYRVKELDEKIRKKRTKSEAKILKELNKIINVPRVLKTDLINYELIEEFIEGKQLKEIIESKTKLAKKTGKEIKKIHSSGIIHGDLTTSNIIYSKNQLFFVDFGLGFYSKKIEDIATDLIVFKKTFNATHSSKPELWKKILEGYNPSAELKEKMKLIEKRSRYH